MSFSGEYSDQRTKSESKASFLSIPTVFHFWNGDEYKGQYQIVKDKQKIIMEGRGEYKTSDGHMYEGIWSDDSLVEDCKITFPDRSVFTGFLEDMVMQGPGKYTFKERVSLEGEFLNNRLMGMVFLKDPNNHIWQSTTEEGDVLMHFRAQHPFWQSMLCPFYNSSTTYQIFYGEADGETE